MNKVTLDAATAAALREAAAGTELVGPDGQPVGGFVPPNLLYLLRHVLEEQRRMIDEANAEVSVEKLRAIRAAGGGIPHAEVMKQLGLDKWLK